MADGDNKEEILPEGEVPGSDAKVAHKADAGVRRCTDIELANKRKRASTTIVGVEGNGKASDASKMNYDERRAPRHLLLICVQGTTRATPNRTRTMFVTTASRDFVC